MYKPEVYSLLRLMNDDTSPLVGIPVSCRLLMIRSHTYRDESIETFDAVTKWHRADS
jgi:hypothetical protein